MRAGNYRSIWSDYKNNWITFSCPANWIDYAAKQKKRNITSGIEDWHECTFAHVDKSFNENGVTNGRGIPSGSNLLCSVSSKDGSKFLAQIPVILTPALCFFSFGNIAKRILSQEDNTDRIGFGLDNYLHNLGYQEKGTGYLFITNYKWFAEELTEQIPIAIKKNIRNMNSDAFTIPFDSKNPVIMNEVDYNRYKISDYFYIQDSYLDAMFCKDKSFEYQSEMRIVIPHINFNQRFPKDNYDYKQNQLKVFLPNLRKYATVLSAEQFNHISFRLEADGSKNVEFKRIED